MPLLLDDVIERDELLTGETFYVQCMSHGFVGVARVGSDLEVLCQTRADSGKLDALILHGGDQCPECRRREQQDWAYYVLNVRPFDEPEDQINEAPWVERANQREAQEKAMLEAESVLFLLTDAEKLEFDRAFHSNDREEQIQRLATRFGLSYEVAMDVAACC